MRKLCRKLSVILIFFIVYYFLFIRFDEYDFLEIRAKYFGELEDTFMVDEFGKRISKYSPFPTIKYINDLSKSKSYSIILGDSRVAGINPVHLAKEDKKKNTTWLNLSYGGCTIEESITEFYYLIERVKIDKVIFELDFKALSPSIDTDRLEAVKKLDKLELYSYYIFNYYNNRLVLENTANFMEKNYLNTKIDSPNVDKEYLVRRGIEEYSEWIRGFHIDRKLVDRII